jgi:hypothetical protein
MTGHDARRHRERLPHCEESTVRADPKTSYHRGVFNLDVTMEIGSYLTKKVRFPTGAPSSEWRGLVEKFIREHKRDKVAMQLASRGALDGGEGSFIDLGWMIAWSQSAFQSVIVKAKHAAALMATNAGDDPDILTVRPWNAYTIEIPVDLITIPLGDELVSMDVIGVWHHPPDKKSRFAVYSRKSRYSFFGELSWPLPDYYAPPPDVEVSKQTEAAALRARDAIARLIVGVQIEITNHATDPSIAPIERRKKRRGDCMSVEHHLLHEVTIDLRDHISDFISGRRGTSPIWKTLVPGHYQGYWTGPKDDPLRPQVLVRKFKEPFWRNNESKLLAVRPHKIVDGSEEGE